MDRYTLTDEGRARFRRMKISGDAARAGGYEILDYLYERGAMTIGEIKDYTGLSWDEIVSRLLVFMNHGLVEETA